MNDADRVFREDPWEGIDDQEASRRLYEKDKRFWVSIDQEDSENGLIGTSNSLADFLGQLFSANSIHFAGEIFANQPSCIAVMFFGAPGSLV